MLRIPGFPFCALLLLLAACDARPPARTVNAASPDAFSQAAATEAPAKANLQAQITLDGPRVTALSPDHVASVPFDPAWRYAWTVEGGSLGDGASSHEVNYSAGASGEVALHCDIHDTSGASLIVSAKQSIIPPPEISAFESFPPALAEGARLRLAWTASDHTRLVLDPGGQDVTSLGFMDVAPKDNTTFILSATNSAGTTVVKELKVLKVPPPLIRAFTWEGSLRNGEPLRLKAEFEGGRAEILQGDSVLASATESPIQTTATPAIGTVFTLRVVSQSSARTTQTLTVATKPVAPKPAAPSQP